MAGRMQLSAEGTAVDEDENNRRRQCCKSGEVENGRRTQLIIENPPTNRAQRRAQTHYQTRKDSLRRCAQTGWGDFGRIGHAGNPHQGKSRAVQQAD